MKLLPLDIIIVKFANFTKVLRHVDSTIRTNPGNLLLSITNCTDDLLNILPNKFVMIIGVRQRARGLVVTVPAGEDLITARGTNLAPSPVVLAPVFHLSEILPLKLFH